jgi:hypothetical protein
VGVKFGREYTDIVADLVQALGKVNGVCDFFEMTQEEWAELNAEQQQECLKTLADDLFYGLGSESSLEIGEGVIQHDASNHILKVHDGDNLVSVIYLV